jgi:Flp pilus assembly protein TadD
MPKLPAAAPGGPVVRQPDFDGQVARAGKAAGEGRRDDAIALLEQVLANEPAHVPALAMLAGLLFDGGDVREALRLVEDLLRQIPNDPDLWRRHGLGLRRLGAFQDAIVSFDRMIALAPAEYAWHALRADTLLMMGRFHDALAAYEPLIPHVPRIWAGLGCALQWCGRFAEAEAAFDRLPNGPQAVLNKASLRLLLGDFPAGRELYERRIELFPGVYRKRSHRPSLAPGTDLRGKTLYVQHELGFGDALQFCRYVPMAAASGAEVILEVPRPLLVLAGSLAGVSRLMTPADAVPDHDYHCFAMSLPRFFRTDIDTVPAAIPYLRPDAQAASAWRERLTAHAGRRIGLVWSGRSRTHDVNLVAMDRRRSVPLDVLAPLASVPGCTFFSLQIGPSAVEAAAAPSGLMLHDYTSELGSFADTAALVENLDLVISVDTSVAHLTGAIGKPVWLLNRFETCWRWLLNRDDSPWYPTMRIFRQPTSGDWAPVVARVGEALRAFAAERTPSL